MLDIRDESVINALPFIPTSVLEVGCGTGKQGKFLQENGVEVLSTDIYVDEAIDTPFRIMSIFDPFDDTWDSVTCCQVLEHLESWQVAFKNLIELAIRIKGRYKNSFNKYSSFGSLKKVDISGNKKSSTKTNIRE